MEMPFYTVPSERRYWVVRAESGTFLDHFLLSRAAAIGHVDEALTKVPDFDPLETDWATIQHRLLVAASEDRSVRELKSLISQARCFIEDIKVGDWILAPSADALVVGVVSGPAFWSDEPISISRPDGQFSVMNFRLRREVEWGPIVFRKDFSSPLRRSLRANQSVFNIDAHWEAICHALYPAFAREDVLYLTAKIRSEGKISNLDVSSFLATLSDIEVIVRDLDRGLNVETFEKRLHQLADADELTLATKAEFYSPGDIWVQLAGDAGALYSHGGWMACFVLAYSMVFGNSKLGFDGLLDLSTRQKIVDLIISRIQVRRTDQAVKHMGLDLPHKDTTVIESQDKNISAGKDSE